MAYTPQWQVLQSQVLAVADQVRRQFPSAWQKCLAPHDDGEYIRRVAFAAQAVSKDIGLNGKRGGSELSKDVLCFPNPSGCPDAGRTYPGLELVDIIVNHERGDADLTWNDVTVATINGGASGKWIKPEAVSGGGPIKPVEPPAPKLISREDLDTAITAINAFYASRDGLQRPGGMVIDGRVDLVAIKQWVYDVISGRTVDQVIAQLKQSEEYRRKHGVS